MSYQMRRMVLVNIGTNQKTTSCLITEIDPRNGATVVGANGVGKTTTLRLIPLFLGHLPSQIVSAGKGQEAMLRFVLPTAQSAIVFEYQRGPSEEHDIRMAVIRRRQDGSDAPEYRFFNSGFKEVLFKGQDGIFFDDEQSTKAALSQEISVTPKLNGTDYRTVILGLRTLTKEAFKLRRLAADYAFGPKPLPNMDRLVAAMVKDHVNFTDLIQVAVGMVQEELGSGITAGRGNLKLKQGKGALAQWIIDREMCSQSIKLRPDSDVLYSRVHEYSQQEISLRTMRVNVQALWKDRTERSETLRKNLTEIEQQRLQARDEERKLQEGLNNDLQEARSANNAASTEYGEKKSRSDYFKENNAAGWVNKFASLPALDFRKTSLNQQISAFDEQASEIENKHASLVSSIEVQTAQECQRLEQSKEEPRREQSTRENEIRRQEREALQLLSDKQQLTEDRIAEQLLHIAANKAGAELSIRNPAASPETMTSLKQADERLQQHATELQSALRLQNALNEDCRNKNSHFHELEEKLTKAIKHVRVASSELLDAEKMNAPAPGTLLAALQNHEDNVWAKNLAKIIDASLLQREDLQPHFHSDGNDTAYGWHFETDAIATPDWTRDEYRDQLITERKEALAAAQTHEDAIRTALTNASKDLSAARANLNAQLAQVQVHEAQQETLHQVKEAASERMAAEIREVVKQARQTLEDLQKEERLLGEEKKEQRSQFASERNAITKHAIDDIATATAATNTTLATIDRQIQAAQEDRTRRIKSLQQDRTRLLKEKGIDPVKLDELKDALVDCIKEIKGIQDKEILIGHYQKWIGEDGPASLLEAEKKKTSAQQTLTQLEQKKEQMIASHNVAEERFENLRRTTRNSKADLENEAQTLQLLDDSLGRFSPFGSVTVDFNADSIALVGQVKEGLKKLNDLEKDIRDKARKLKSMLSTKESAVKNFIDTSLQGIREDDPIELATKLHWCQQRMGQQVILNVNLTLDAVLATVSLFHRDINAFESEISRFNTKLQNALSTVTQFERVKDVKIHITSNFKELDFIRKLDSINDYHREYRSQLARDRTNTVPDDRIAAILQDFMSVIGGDGTLEINLASHVTLHGSVVENGTLKSFKRESELERISSNGLTSIILITLLSGLLNMIRGTEQVHVAWVTDEVGKFDGKNFIALMQLLKDNHIDVVTASPDISPRYYKLFSNRYQLDDGGVIRKCVPKIANVRIEGVAS